MGRTASRAASPTSSSPGCSSSTREPSGCYAISRLLRQAVVEELRSADVLVLGLPMYNFGVPSQLKAWFDHLARAGETFKYTEKGSVGLLNGKKAYVFVARGGIYGEGHPHTRFVREFLAFIGIAEVEFVYAEGLAIGPEHRNNSLSAAHSALNRLASQTRLAA